MTSTITRRTLIGNVTAVTLGIATLRPVLAQESTPAATGATPAGKANAVQLLNDAATVMTELETFQFTIVTAEGETVIFEGLTIDEISGVVRRPVDFETTVTVAVPFATLDLRAVSLGNEVWIEVPTIGESAGGWTSLGSSEGIVSLLNPDVLILESVRYIDNAVIAGTDELDGVPVTIVMGTVDFQEIATSLARDDAVVQSEIAEGPVDLEIVIDEENRIRQIEMAGPLLVSEAGEVVRLVTFSGFNEPVEITEPEIEGTGKGG